MTTSADSDKTLTPEELAIKNKIFMAELYAGAIQDVAALKPFVPPASRSRAKEIAQMEEFGLVEFIELTGVGSGPYGIYHIDEAGVSIRGMQGASSLSSEQEYSLRHAARKFNLSFPCTPSDFTTWYDATRGLPENPDLAEKGISDFPLARGFLPEIDYLSTRPDKPVASPEIVAAFKVRSSVEENAKWWNERMGSAVRYGLSDCRATGGKGMRSTWHPVQVAGWLIGKGHLGQRQVLEVMRDKFPDYDYSYLEI